MFYSQILIGYSNSTAPFSQEILHIHCQFLPWVTDVPYWLNTSQRWFCLYSSFQNMAINHQHLLQPSKQLATYTIQSPPGFFQMVKYVSLKSVFFFSLWYYFKTVNNCDFYHRISSCEEEGVFHMVLMRLGVHGMGDNENDSWWEEYSLQTMTGNCLFVCLIFVVLIGFSEDSKNLPHYILAQKSISNCISIRTNENYIWEQKPSRIGTSLLLYEKGRISPTTFR